MPQASPTTSTIALLGPSGTFTDQAEQRFLATPSQSRQMHGSILSAARAVAAGRAGGAFLPLENTLGGPVLETLRALLENDLRIYRSFQMPIEHCLLCTGSKEGITEIASHPQALAQCSVYLREAFPNAVLREMPSTAAAATAAQNSPHLAAIAGPEQANGGLHVLATDIANAKGNATRFCLAAPLRADIPQDSTPKKRRTLLFFETENEVGALGKVLGIFEHQHINLSSLCSVPLSRPQEFGFFVLFDGGDVQLLEQALSNNTRQLRVLGSFVDEL